MAAETIAAPAAGFAAPEEHGGGAFTGPIDPDRVIMIREEGRAERGPRMSLNETIAYLLNQEPNDYPRGMNNAVAEICSGMNNHLGDVQRQRLRPLAREMAGTYCWRCTLTRLDLLTGMTAREFLPLVLAMEGLGEDADTLANWQGDITEAAPVLRTVLQRREREGRKYHTPAVGHTRTMLGIMEETARRTRFVIEPGECPGEEISIADGDFTIALAAKRLIPEHRWADMMISQARRMIAICPHVDRSRSPWSRSYHPWWS